jgi:general secretion pathway protein G
VIRWSQENHPPRSGGKQGNDKGDPLLLDPGKTGFLAPLRSVAFWGRRTIRSLPTLRAPIRLPRWEREARRAYNRRHKAINPMLRPIYAKVIGIIAVIVAVLLFGVLLETRMSIHKAREQVLSDGLATTRAIINQYTIDKNHRPRSLEDLFAAGYAKSLPDDPFTGSNGTWVIERDQNGDIVGIHSRSKRIGSNGKPYSSW